MQWDQRIRLHVVPNSSFVVRIFVDEMSIFCDGSSCWV